MANEGNVICGLDPMPDNKGQVNVRPMIPISLASNFGIFKGSPYRMLDSDGTIFVFDGGSDPQSLCSGSVVKIYNSVKKEVINLPAGTPGFADVTFEKSQRYQIVASGTGFSDTGSDNGLTYGLTTETSEALTNGIDGPGNSTVMMDTTQEHATHNTFLASFKVKKPRNLGAANHTLVEGKINPTCFQVW